MPLRADLHPGHPCARRRGHEADVCSVRHDQSPPAGTWELNDGAPVLDIDSAELDLEAVARDRRSCPRKVAGHLADDIEPGLARSDGDQAKPAQSSGTT